MAASYSSSTGPAAASFFALLCSAFLLLGLCVGDAGAQTAG